MTFLPPHSYTRTQCVSCRHSSCSHLLVHHPPWRRILSLRHRRCFKPYSLILTTNTHDRSCDMGIQENFFWRREDWKVPIFRYNYCRPFCQRHNLLFSRAAYSSFLILVCVFVYPMRIFKWLLHPPHHVNSGKILSQDWIGRSCFFPLPARPLGGTAGRDSLRYIDMPITPKSFVTRVTSKEMFWNGGIPSAHAGKLPLDR